MTFYQSYGKRAFDLVITSLVLVIMSPLLLALVIMIRLKLGRPITFRQQRTGWRRRPFHIIKFRSMLDTVDDQGRLLADEHRLTPFGRWLRASSLDELPGLLNIVRGEMSIVGPRPLVHVYDTLYSAEQARRFEVRPGLTGWAQVNGRNAIGWPEKFALDVWYVDRQSLSLDGRIIAATVGRVFARDGINATEATTMLPFKGETEVASHAPQASSTLK